MEDIKRILNDENRLEFFFETLYNAIEQDDEPWYKKGRQLLLLALKDEFADDFFISICGYSVKSLLKLMDEKTKSD